MSITKRWLDELEREEPEFEPRYGEEVEQWPSEDEEIYDMENHE